MLWIGRKPSLSYIRIWSCTALVLRRNSDKLKARSKLVYFDGYTKRTKEDQFYDPQEYTVIGSTYAVFMKMGYMID